MQESPKEQPDLDKESPDPENPDSWEADQKKRDYYYDDSHGYVIYDPEADEEERKSGHDVPGRC